MVCARRRPRKQQTKKRHLRRPRQHSRRVRGGNNQIQLDVFFNDTKITAGQQLAAEEVQTAPRIHFAASEGNYTLVMWDPDVSVAVKPAWAHYIITNMTPNSQQGDILLSYMPPTPPSGIHRYFFTLYRQTVSAVSSVPTQRGNFDIAEFVAANQLQKAAETYIKVAAVAA
jgi:phosphatidylethanolamine-binding protein (PEBP) family uncharacterized protein